MLTARVERWRDEGTIEEVLGRRLFVHRQGGEADPLRRAGSPPVFVVGH